MKKLLIFLLVIFAYSKTTDNTLRITYQNLKFNNEHLGLLETSYLFNFSNFYSGISVYSAVNGKRGGFFTGGITAGYKYKINRFILDGGFFIGGGGGGHAPQGSGLMIKGYAGVLYSINKFDIGININRIKFKDGEIDSTQVGFISDYNFKEVYFFKKPKKLFGKYGIEKLSFEPFVLEYFPIDSKTTQGQTQKRFTLIGAQISKDFDKFFAFLSASGAARGESDGYAEYLFGIGKKLKYLKLKASIGAGGGGEVNTKGGFIYKIESESNFKNINLSGGFMNAPGGIKALFAKLSYSKKFKFITTGNKLIKFKLQKFNIKFYNESYMPSNTIRKNDDSKRLDVINLDLGIYKNENYLLYLNAGAAYNGQSGGYAIGMFGAEYDIKNFFINTAIGAAGGGNVDVGGGLLAKIYIGYKFSKFFIGLGRIKAFNGRLNTTIINFGINFDFYKGVK
jgi:hypothetical protein